MPAPDLKTLGRYTIQRVLGRGAMGVVYEGTDPKLDRSVAIKTILKTHLDDSAARDYSARFVREAHAVARLNHPHIVQVYDFGEEGDIAYLVMEFIRGRELQSFFNANERFEPKEAVRIMGELSSALEFAHQAGIIHRDVKPANVMLDSQGHTKLTDFGVARVQDVTRSHATQAGTLVGTPAYMSPEQITGTAVDRRTDVFAAGIILYQFLTGELPFSGGGPWTIAKKIMQDQPALPSTINTSVSPRFDAVVAKALAKEPEQRYQSMRAFSVALKLALEGKPEEDDADKTVVYPATRAPSAAAPAQPAPQTGTHPGTQPGMQEAEVEFWRSVKDSSDAEDFDAYLRKFPNGIYADLAQRKVARLRGEANEQARRAAEEKAKLDAEARKREIEENARREAEEEARRAEQAKRDAAERAKREAQEKVKREAEARARKRQQQAGEAETPDRKPVLIGTAAAIVLALVGGAVWLAMKGRAPEAPQAKPDTGTEQRQAAERAAADRAMAEKLAVDKAAVEKLMADAKAAQEKAAADRIAAQKAVADLAAAERAASDRTAAAKLAGERAAAERVAAEKAAVERQAVERAAAAKLAADKAAAERAAVERSAAERAAAERAAAERAAAERAKVAQAKAPAAAPSSPLPQAGDTWTYRFTSLDRKDSSGKYTVSVTDASSVSILESYALDGGRPGSARHETGAYLGAFGPVLFSPYLAQFQDLSPGASVGRITVRDGSCPADYLCQAAGRVIGRETVRVPAGTYEALKIVIDHTWRAAYAGDPRNAGQFSGGRTLTVWYAPSVKRAVKYTSRLTVGEIPAVEANFDLELTSFQAGAAERAPVASAKPETKIAAAAPASASMSPLPQAGDSWNYRFTSLDRKDSSGKYAVSVTEASSASILESYALDGVRPGSARHERGAYLGAFGPVLFSPYLAQFQDMAPGMSLGRVTVRDGSCPADYLCQAAGRVIGRETVRVPAGSFDAYRVVIDHTWRAAYAGDPRNAGQFSGGRTLTVWYAPSVKRAVKYTSRLTVGEIPAVEANFDLELVSYKLQ